MSAAFHGNVRYLDNYILGTHDLIAKSYCYIALVASGRIDLIRKYLHPPFYQYGSFFELSILLRNQPANDEMVQFLRDVYNVAKSKIFSRIFYIGNTQMFISPDCNDEKKLYNLTYQSQVEYLTNMFIELSYNRSYYWIKYSHLLVIGKQI